MSMSDAVFLVTTYCFFDHNVLLILSFSFAHFFHLFNSTGVGVVALATLRWSVFVSKKLSQVCSFH